MPCNNMFRYWNSNENYLRMQNNFKNTMTFIETKKVIVALMHINVLVIIETNSQIDAVGIDNLKRHCVQHEK